MNRNVALAMAGCLLFGAAHGVRISETTGQVLIYPLYTTQRLDTLLLLNNDSDTAKAVGVTVRESQLGISTLSFIVYLMPRATFVAALTDFGRLGIGSGPGMVVPDADDTCTYPPIGAIASSRPGQRILELDHRPARQAGAQPGSARMGYLEAIELGGLPQPPVDLRDCLDVRDAWVDGVWAEDPAHGLEPPDGGLFGEALLVDVRNGEAYSYDATALSDYRSTAMGVPPEAIPPMAEGGESRTAAITIDGELKELAFQTSRAAVAAALTATTLRTEPLVHGGIGGTAELILTLPTFITDVTGRQADPRPPFVAQPHRFAVEHESIYRGGIELENCNYPDQEGGRPSDRRVLLLERAQTSLPFGVDWRTNAITGATTAPDMLLNGEPRPYLDPHNVLEGHFKLGLGPGAQLVCQFEGLAGPHLSPPAIDETGKRVRVSGLPVLAVSMSRLRNATLQGGNVLANYGIETRIIRHTTLVPDQP